MMLDFLDGKEGYYIKLGWRRHGIHFRKIVSQKLPAYEE
jgi:hypothetical protein